MSDISPIVPQTGYIELGLVSDPVAMTAAAIAAIGALVPGWVPNENSPEMLVLEQAIDAASESAVVANSMSQAAFQYFGQLVNILPQNGAPATALTTWTMVDTKGYTVPAGTIVAYAMSGTTFIQFQTVAAFTVLVGSSTTSPGAVQIQSSVIGTVNNGIADTVPIVPVNQLSFVASIAATVATSGGADPETLPAYMNRLSDTLELLTPRPILPGDFAALAVSATNTAGVSLGVDRAVAINGLNPGRTITGTITLNATTALVDTAGSFTASDVGKSVTGTDIPASTTISAYVSTTQVTMSAAATPNATLSTALVAGTAYTSLAVTALTIAIASGQNVVLASGGNTQTYVASAAAAVGATAIAVTSLAANYAYPVGTLVNATNTILTATLGDLTGVARCVTVAAVDSYGNALTPTIEAELSTYLEARREINFLVPVIGPTYTSIDVTWIGLAVPGASTTVVQAAGNAALTNYLASSNWAGGNGVPPYWDGTQVTIGYLALAGVLGTVANLQRVTSLTFAIHGNTLGTADVTLAGDAPLSATGTITGSVTSGT